MEDEQPEEEDEVAQSWLDTFVQLSEEKFNQVEEPEEPEDDEDDGEIEEEEEEEEEKIVRPPAKEGYADLFMFLTIMAGQAVVLFIICICWYICRRKEEEYAEEMQKQAQEEKDKEKEQDQKLDPQQNLNIIMLPAPRPDQ